MVKPLAAAPLQLWQLEHGPTWYQWHNAELVNKVVPQYLAAEVGRWKPKFRSISGKPYLQTMNAGITKWPFKRQAMIGTVSMQSHLDTQHARVNRCQFLRCVNNTYYNIVLLSLRVILNGYITRHHPVLIDHRSITVACSSLCAQMPFGRLGWAAVSAGPEPRPGPDRDCPPGVRAKPGRLPDHSIHPRNMPVLEMFKRHRQIHFGSTGQT